MKVKFRSSRNAARFLVSEKATGVRPVLPVTYKINGHCEPARLAKAVDLVVASNQALRARTRLEVSGDCQVTLEQDGCPLEYRDLRGQSSSSIIAIRKAISEKISEFETIFDSQLLRVGDEEYYFTAIFHHSLVDGVSIGLFFKQLEECYNGVALGKDAEIPLQDTVGESVVFELERAQATEEFWRNEFRNLAELAPIAAALPDQESLTGTGFLSRSIPSASHDVLRAHASAIGVRTFSYYLAVGQIVLARMTGQPDVLTSIQSAGRKHFPHFANEIGLFSRALVVRSVIDSELDFETFVRMVDSKVAAVLDHEAMPYQEICQISGASPRFAFNWYPVQSPPRFVHCISREVVIYPWPTTFDVNFHFVKKDGGVELRLFFDREACDSRTARMLARHFLTLLSEVSKSTSRSVARLPTLGGAIGKRSTESTRSADIANEFFEVALRNPAAHALSEPREVLTFQELMAAVQESSLVFSELQCECPVILFIGQRGSQLICSALGALGSGGSFALIDSEYPQGRIIKQIETLKPDAIITDVGVELPRDCLFGPYSTLREPNEKANIGGLYARSAKSQRRITEGVAYWLFTSGTTGEPKCVPSGHAPLIHALSWQRAKFEIGDKDRVSFLSGVGHDPALRDIFLPILGGGVSCIPNSSRMFEPGYLFDWLRSESVTVTHVTPAMIQLLDADRSSNTCLENVRHVFVGGEHAGAHVRKLSRMIFPNAKITNVYGATETPQFVLYNDISKFSGDRRARRALGYPRDDVAVDLVDASGRVCGYFEPGEIRVSTPYLSLGYLGAKEFDRGGFEYREDSDTPTAYRTGDVGYNDNRNGVVYVGRQDDQVKIRGYRVELSEILAQLTSILGHDNAAVLALDHEESSRLVAFIAGEFKNSDSKNLRSALQKVLPNYMIPSTFVAIEQLPRLKNGKLDRAALKTLSLDSAADTNMTAFDTPRDDAERELVEMWERILGTSPISVTESLFDLGGDSLTGVMLMVEMERNGLDENIARLALAGATIREIAQIRSSGTQVEGVPTYSKSEPILSRTAVHMARGILVILIISGHWFPGLAERASFFAPLQATLSPIFNLSTPGFAIIFGVSFGYFNYETYLTRQPIFNRQRSLGILFLVGAVLFISVNLALTRFFSDMPLTMSYLISSLYSVVGYYLLALLSLPLWFAYFKRFGFGGISMAGGLVILMSFDQIGQFYLPHDIQEEGLRQLARNYLAAKFSYFNMSIGVIAGLYAGRLIRLRPELPRNTSFIALSIAMSASAILWGAHLGELQELSSGSTRIDYWKWMLYLGVIMVLLSAIWTFLRSDFASKASIAWSVKLLSSIGTLALFFFVAHGAVLSVKDLFVAMGLQDTVSVMLALSLFVLLSVYAIQKMWRLHF